MSLTSFTWGLHPYPWAQELHLSSASDHFYLPSLCSRSAGLQASIWLCLLGRHQTCVAGLSNQLGPGWGPTACLIVCLQSSIWLFPAAPEGTPWMDPGLGLLLAVPGTVDGPHYQHPVGLPELCAASTVLPSAPGLSALGKFCAKVLGLAPLCFAKVRWECVAANKVKNMKLKLIW